MSRTRKPKQPQNAVTPELLELVRRALAGVKPHGYSASLVYAAYNAAFGKNERPQMCGTCVYRRVRELRAWLDGYEKSSKRAEAKNVKSPDSAPCSIEVSNPSTEADKIKNSPDFSPSVANNEASAAEDETLL